MALTVRDDPALGPPSGAPGFPAALMLRGRRDPYTELYLGNPNHRWTDPAREAYNKAIESLSKELTPDECQAIWLHSRTSMGDVQDAVVEAQKEYKSRSKDSKIRKWLNNASSRVMYYGAIFDMFAQHHPEYVSLAWGAMKFLFIAVLNHEELLVEVAKGVSRIADALPRAELHSDLYPTERVQEAVASVYAKIIEFDLLAIKFYKKGRLLHSITSIVKPFSLSFKPVVEEIMERSRRVDEEASMASKAEIRSQHFKIHQLIETVAAQQSLLNQIMLDVREQKQFFRNAVVEDIRTTITIGDTPASEDTLSYCRSMRNRRRLKVPAQLPLSELQKVKAWLAEPSSSILLAEGQGVRTSCLDFATDFLDAVLDAGYPVLWALPSAVQDEAAAVPSIKGILRSLILQALELDPALVSEGCNPVTKQHIRSAASFEQWFDLLERCLSNFARLFLIIDMGVIEAALSQESDDDEVPYTVSSFVERLTELVKTRRGGGLKVVVVSWKFEAVASLETEEIIDETRIFTDRGRRVERLMRQPKYRAAFKQRNKRFSGQLGSMVRSFEQQSVSI
ncbi:Nacht domain protein [Pleurostoma richardsiae]|uniref:Nacht domain protein n=1 Tax=Pleurostoma richardsiae TaxID=41990 RepID=A0AA38RBH2_9PEZI|nr:Nacht domain protein [Pleurostoma richardsiae]